MPIADEVRFLRDRAAKLRASAKAYSTELSRVLLDMSDDLEARARELESRHLGPQRQGN
jgi:hypothetical protein